MNFLGKRIVILDDFITYPSQDRKNDNFFRMETLGLEYQAKWDFYDYYNNEELVKKKMELFFSQLGAIISSKNDAKKGEVDFIFIGDKHNQEKIKRNFSNVNSESQILTSHQISEKISSDIKELSENPKLLCEIQKIIVQNHPEYICNNLLDESCLNLIKEKLSDKKIKKSWLENFYKNIILEIPKEEMVSKFGSEKAKKIALEWILKNDSLESFKAKNEKDIEPLFLLGDKIYLRKKVEEIINNPLPLEEKAYKNEWVPLNIEKLKKLYYVYSQPENEVSDLVEKISEWQIKNSDAIIDTLIEWYYRTAENEWDDDYYPPEELGIGEFCYEEIETEYGEDYFYILANLLYLVDDKIYENILKKNEYSIYNGIPKFPFEFLK